MCVCVFTCRQGFDRNTQIARLFLSVQELEHLPEEGSGFDPHIYSGGSSSAGTTLVESSNCKDSTDYDI